MMDELKNKLLVLVHKQVTSPRILNPGGGDAQTSTSVIEEFAPVVNVHRELPECVDVEPWTDEEVLESVERDLLVGTNYDPVTEELKLLPETLDIIEIESELSKRRDQYKVISKKVLQLILDKKVQCEEETRRVLELQDQLNSAIRICRTGREGLSVAQAKFTSTSLGIVANIRKKQSLKGVLRSLNTIKTLLQTQERLQELLHDGHYSGAISLIQECCVSAYMYSHFKSISTLSSKLQDILENIEQQLDSCLSKVCANFNPEYYHEVQKAYALLGKTQMAMDHLHMHFSSAIHSTVYKIVNKNVGESTDLNSSTSTKVFKQLCKRIAPEKFISCLKDLCKGLWEIMRSYKNVIDWHQQHHSQNLSAESIDIEISHNESYIQQKLETGVCRIWQDVQLKICVYLMGCDLSVFKFEEFLQVLSIVHRLMEVGEEFCGSKSIELQNSIKEQSCNYFKTYHKERMEELRIFLENECWELCPVKSNFTILYLQEFKCLRYALKHLQIGDNQNMNVSTSKASSPDCSSTISQDGSSNAGGYFSRFAENGSPFDIIVDEVQDDDILSNFEDHEVGEYSDDSDDDIPEELKKDFVEEGNGDLVRITKPITRKVLPKHCVNVPILTNTTLTVLRYCGKYLHMSQLLRAIASEVITGLGQLFEYYMYAVYTFFTSDLPLPENEIISLKLHASLKMIEKSLILTNESDRQMEEIEMKDKVIQPHISPVVNLKSSSNLYGLAVRIVAVESLVFLSKQVTSLRPFLEQLLPAENTKFFKHFYDKAISVTSELRKPVYMCVSARVVDFGRMLTMMNTVDWEVKEVMTEHSSYVDALIRELKSFANGLEKISTVVPIAPEIRQILWENIVLLICNTFVEGFSNAKKCSAGGRGLMQLDFTQFLTQLDQIIHLRPIPNKEFVEVYVKAYYHPETTLESWIREHTEYSGKQLQALVSCICYNKKKTRHKLNAIIDEVARIGR